jgi:hypothetical protein
MGTPQRALPMPGYINLGRPPAHTRRAFRSCVFHRCTLRTGPVGTSRVGWSLGQPLTPRLTPLREPPTCPIRSPPYPGRESSNMTSPMSSTQLFRAATPGTSGGSPLARGALLLVALFVVSPVAASVPPEQDRTKAPRDVRATQHRSAPDLSLPSGESGKVRRLADGVRRRGDALHLRRRSA